MGVPCTFHFDVQNVICYCFPQKCCESSLFIAEGGKYTLNQILLAGLWQCRSKDTHKEKSSVVSSAGVIWLHGFKWTQCFARRNKIAMFLAKKGLDQENNEVELGSTVPRGCWLQMFKQSR